MPEQAVYTPGHHASVVKSHARRTAQNSAAFLLPYIEPHHRILDVGCGPGSITIGIAKLVPQGTVIGIDGSEDVLREARELARENGVSDQVLTFQKHDANGLPFADDEFDIVFCHQLLQHVKEPVTILKEMARVCRKGGVVAAREVDYRTFGWYPEMEDLTIHWNLYERVIKGNGAEPNAGRHVKAWAREAGFKKEDITFSWSSWNYQDEEAVIWGRSWIDRTLQSSFATGAIEQGLATLEDLQRISESWRKWSEQEGALFIIPNGEIICRVR